MLAVDIICKRYKYILPTCHFLNYKLNIMIKLIYMYIHDRYIIQKCDITFE